MPELECSRSHCAARTPGCIIAMLYTGVRPFSVCVPERFRPSSRYLQGCYSSMDARSTIFDCSYSLRHENQEHLAMMERRELLVSCREIDTSRGGCWMIDFHSTCYEQSGAPAMSGSRCSEIEESVVHYATYVRLTRPGEIGPIKTRCKSQQHSA